MLAVGRWWWKLVLAGMTAAGAGCADVTVTVRPDRTLLPAGRPYTYSDQHWAGALYKYVREGLVDYRGLAADPEQPLQRYYALISEVGPARSPDQFPTRQVRVAYWINAYNALVLVAVLHRYPVDTMYDLVLPRLEHEYRFRVDGQVRNLAWIEAELLKESAQDARVLFATSRAALGAPRLSGEPFRADTLERQLARAATEALDNPDLLRIDHLNRVLLVWNEVLTRQGDFEAYWRSRRRVQNVHLFNVLLDLASPACRQALQGAVGYRMKPIGFRRDLNDLNRSVPRVKVP